MDLLDGDVELTEFVEIDVKSVKGVRHGANGFPPLLMKGIGEPAAELPAAAEPPAFDRAAALAAVKAIVGRKVDESPDIAGGTAVLAQIADLIIAEAQELKAGNASEIDDIRQLACAAEMIWCWRTGEEAVAAGSVQPATALMQSVADMDWTPGNVEKLGALYEAARQYAIAKSGPSAEERRQAASEGNALPDGSYPIRNAHELHAAAVLARSGHGDAAAAKRLIARRAKELGVANPLDTNDDSDASKSQIAPEGTNVDTVTQGNGDLIAKAVEDAVAKALAPAEERIKALADELAKVKALPVPGGPMMTRVTQPRAEEDGEDHAAKAMQYDTVAEQLADQGVADVYRKLAAQHRAKITV